MNEHVVEKLSALSLARQREIAHPNPRRAIKVGLLMIAAAAREAILFPESTLASSCPEASSLASELARAYRAVSAFESLRRSLREGG